MEQFQKDKLNAYTEKKAFNKEQTIKAYDLYNAILAEKKGSKFYKMAIRQGWYDIEGIKVTHLRQIKTLLRKIAKEEVEGISYEITPEFDIFKELTSNERQVLKSQKKDAVNKPHKKEKKIELKFSSEPSDAEYFPARIPELANTDFTHACVIPSQYSFESMTYPTVGTSSQSVLIERTDPLADNMSVPFGYLAVEDSYKTDGNKSSYEIVQQSQNPHDFFYSFLEQRFNTIEIDMDFVQNYKDLIMFLISGCEKGFPTIDPLIENLECFIGAQWARAYYNDFGRAPRVNGDYVRTREKEYSNENLDHLNDSPSKIIEHGLTQGYGNCLSFSYAICYLLNQIGLRSVVMLADASFKGSSFSTPGHAWIEIFHNGEMIKFDPTNHLQNNIDKISELPFRDDFFEFLASHTRLLKRYKFETSMFSTTSHAQCVGNLIDEPKSPIEVIKASIESKDQILGVTDKYHPDYIKNLLQWQLVQTFYDKKGVSSKNSVERDMVNIAMVNISNLLNGRSTKEQQDENEDQIQMHTIDISKFMGIFGWLDHLVFDLSKTEKENFNFISIVENIFNCVNPNSIIKEIKKEAPVIFALLIESFKFISLTHEGLLYRNQQKLKQKFKAFSNDYIEYFSNIDVSEHTSQGVESYIYEAMVGSIEQTDFEFREISDVLGYPAFEISDLEDSIDYQVAPIRLQKLKKALSSFSKRTQDFNEYELREIQHGDCASKIVFRKSQIPHSIIVKDFTYKPQIQSKGIILSSSKKGVEDEYRYQMPEGSLQSIEMIVLTCIESRIDLMIPSLDINDENTAKLYKIPFSKGLRVNHKLITRKIYNILLGSIHGILKFKDPKLRNMHQIIIQNDERVVELRKGFFNNKKIIEVI